jgi:hypothetical protein
MRTSRFVLALSQKSNVRCDVALDNPPKSRHKRPASCRVTSEVLGRRDRRGVANEGVGLRSLGSDRAVILRRSGRVDCSDLR